MSELQQVTGSDSTPLKARALSSVTGPLQWQPGDKYAYGNQGMNIAARIVGQPLRVVAARPELGDHDQVGIYNRSDWTLTSAAADFLGSICRRACFCRVLWSTPKRSVKMSTGIPSE